MIENRSDDNSKNPNDPQPDPRAGSSVESPSTKSQGPSIQYSYSQSSPIPPSPQLDDQKTVISKQPPVSDKHLTRFSNPFELGKQLIGQQLDHFLLEKFVGGGGMGAVFRATDTMLGRTVAVKVLSSNQDDEDIRRRFRNEAQSAARLDHENIARVYFVGEDKGRCYIVFEFIEGVNIRDLIVDNGPLSLEDAIHYTQQVAEALEHASQRDVVHRDIKPSNVLITAEGQAKLVDMGLARLHQVESSAEDLTASGMTLGTFDYISPEQARDPRGADVRSDIYSLGCTLFYMLTGQPPFPEGTMLQKVISHSSDPPPELQAFRPEIPPEISAIVNKMLAKQPADRFQTPGDLIAELLLTADHLGLQIANRGGKVWVAHRTSRVSFWEKHVPWVTSVVAIAGLIAAIMFLDRSWRSNEDTALNHRRPVLNERVPANRVDNRVERQSSNITEEPRESGPDSETTSPSPESSNNNTKKSTSKEVPPSAGESANSSSESAADSSDNAAADVELISENIGPPEFEASISSAGLDEADNTLASTEGVRLRLGQTALSITEEPTTASADAPEVLIVGDPLLIPPPNSRLVSSLSEACDLARTLPSVKTIEIRVDGEQVETGPFDIATESLTIRAGEDFEPVIVFRPQVGGFLSDQQMIRVEGGSLNLIDLHFRLELPKDPADGRWALFNLHQVKRLSMHHCSMTIQNAESAGITFQETASFFELQSSRSMSSMGDEEASSHLPAISIDLQNCIARGQATLIRAEQILPFSLKWRQGLFVSSERLISTGGSAQKTLFDGVVEVDLEKVTAIMRRGMCLMDSSADAPNQLLLDIECTDCILLTGQSAPLIEQRSDQSIEDIEKMLAYGGKGNFYPEINDFATDVYKRIVVLRDPNEEEDYNFDPQENGSNEIAPRRDLSWNQFPGSNLPVHQQIKSDYLLKKEDGNPASRSANDHGSAGFDTALLPEIPLVESTNSASSQ